jgi:hypothetical protein
MLKNWHTDKFLHSGGEGGEKKQTALVPKFIKGPEERGKNNPDDDTFL